MTEQPKEYKFGYFSRHKYQDLVFYVVNEDGQTNTGLFEMPDTPENKELMEARIPRPVSTPPEGAAPDYEHCGNMSSDGEHDCNYRGGHCNFAHTRHCKDFIPCTCEYCDGTVHDAAIRQEAIAEHDWLLRQNRDNLLCFYENPEKLKKFKDEIAQEAREEVLPLVKAAQKTQAELFHACWDKNLIDCVKQLGSDLRAIERSLRHPRKGVPE